MKENISLRDDSLIHDSVHNANCALATVICVKLWKVLKMLGMNVLY